MIKTFAVLASLALTLVLTLASYSAKAADCPVQFGHEDYLTQVSQALSAAPNCYEAVTIAESCALGASGDLAITMAAGAKCESGFTRKLSKAGLREYSSLLSKCTRKYAKMEGTMYVSAAGFCRLSVSRLYYDLYTPAE